MSQLVGDVARHHLGECGDGVGNAFDEAKHGGGNAEYGQKARQDDRGGFVAEIPQ